MGIMTQRPHRVGVSINGENPPRTPGREPASVASTQAAAPCSSLFPRANQGNFCPKAVPLQPSETLAEVPPRLLWAAGRSRGLPSNISHPSWAPAGEGEMLSPTRSPPGVRFRPCCPEASLLPLLSSLNQERSPTQNPGGPGKAGSARVPKGTPVAPPSIALATNAQQPCQHAV